MADSFANVLAVCHANVCRSPLMAYDLGEAFARLQTRDEIRVSSAGIRKVGTDICTVVARHIISRGGERFVGSHVPTQVTTEAVEAADLILVAGSTERSAIGRLCPDARHKTFTLLEALQLSRLQPNTVEGGHDAPSETEPSALATAVWTLHRRRGLIPERKARPLWWLRDASGGFDVPDVHFSSVRLHGVMLKSVDGATKHLADQLFRLSALDTPQ